MTAIRRVWPLLSSPAPLRTTISSSLMAEPMVAMCLFLPCRFLVVDGDTEIARLRSLQTKSAWGEDGMLEESTDGLICVLVPRAEAGRLHKL